MDAATFRQLCTVELSVDPVITFTRRLGDATGNRVRPLLVGLRSAENVSSLMMRAKELRQSTTESVRCNVFVNRNMTKVQARLAYEERCRRRHLQQIGGQLATRYRRDEQYQSHTPPNHILTATDLRKPQFHRLTRALLLLHHRCQSM